MVCSENSLANGGFSGCGLRFDLHQNCCAVLAFPAQNGAIKVFFRQKLPDHRRRQCHYSSARGSSASILPPGGHILTAVCTSCAALTSRSTAFLRTHFPAPCHGMRRGCENCLSKSLTRGTGTVWLVRSRVLPLHGPFPVHYHLCNERSAATEQRYARIHLYCMNIRYSAGFRCAS